MLLGTKALRIDRETETPRGILLMLDRSKLYSVVKPAIADLLLKVHIYKATANVKEGLALFDRLSQVDEEMQLVRACVVIRGRPLKQFVQANTFIEGNDVIVKEYEASVAGLLQSWAERTV